MQFWLIEAGFHPQGSVTLRGRAGVVTSREKSQLLGVPQKQLLTHSLSS